VYIIICILFWNLIPRLHEAWTRNVTYAFLYYYTHECIVVKLAYDFTILSWQELLISVITLAFIKHYVVLRNSIEHWYSAFFLDDNGLGKVFWGNVDSRNGINTLVLFEIIKSKLSKESKIAKYLKVISSFVLALITFLYYNSIMFNYKSLNTFLSIEVNS